MLYFFFSICLVCICRQLFSFYISLACKKKEYIAVKRSSTHFDNWFMVSVSKIVKDRYSKYEKRINKYSRNAKLFIAAKHTTLHLSIRKKMRTG